MPPRLMRLSFAIIAISTLGILGSDAQSPQTSPEWKKAATYMADGFDIWQSQFTVAPAADNYADFNQVTWKLNEGTTR